jgi:ATP-dependent RNA helicase RhlE
VPGFEVDPRIRAEPIRQGRGQRPAGRGGPPRNKPQGKPAGGRGGPRKRPASGRARRAG